MNAPETVTPTAVVEPRSGVSLLNVLIGALACSAISGYAAWRLASSSRAASPVVIVDTERIAAAPVAPKSSKPADASEEPFSAKWLQQNMPKLLERAIDSPIKENVEAYLYAQRVAMDKSQVYAESARRVVASDPFLDENNRVPLSTYAKPSFLK